MTYLLVVLLAWSCTSNVNAIYAENSNTLPTGVTLKDGAKFDYIVVGAGAGGAAVSARLALAGNDVLLIEAGGDPDIISQIPSMAMASLGSVIDWNYSTISNNVSCLSSEGQQCRFHRGKCLGGSTSINDMLYTRGNKQKDFAEIPYPGWTFKDLMPYLLRYEALQDLPLLPPSSRFYHNTTGNMAIEFFDDPQNSWHTRLKKAFTSLKFPDNPDVNAESQIGVTQLLGYVHQGGRMSTARGYLARADVKRTLKVAKNTRCTGVIIDKNYVTSGVTAVQGLRSLKVYARKEVILSAGAIGTPQILMLSGIGPGDHLKSMKIPVKVDLPVGDNMLDHILPTIVLQVNSNVGILNFLTKTATQAAQLLLTRDGALTSIGITDISVFANTKCYDFERRMLLTKSVDGSDCEVPNLQIIHAYIEQYLIDLVKPIFKRLTNFKDDVIEQFSKANQKQAFITMTPVLLEPDSVGTVRLASKDPLAPPAIYPNYLGDKRDVEEMVRSIGIIEQVAETSVFRRRNGSVLRLNLPGCPSYEDDRQEYWRCYIRHMTFAPYHSAGTAQLGTVVDARLRVFGVKRLRVADLSVLPRPPRANSEAVTIAIGERAAEFLLEDNK